VSAPNITSPPADCRIVIMGSGSACTAPDDNTKPFQSELEGDDDDVDDVFVQYDVMTP
jgi:hypothetical protein